MKENIFDDEYEKFVKSYQYYAFEDQFENSQKNSQKYKKSYNNNFYDYDDINDIYFVNKEIKHLYNKCDISFLSKNKLFKHLRETYRKPKTFETVFETFEIVFEASDAIFGIYAVIFETDGTSISSEKFVTLMVNNVKIVTIIHSIVELCDIIVKSGYNFRN